MEKKAKKSKIFIIILMLAVCILLIPYFLFHNSAKKYGGHGLDYMHGYSSTDFKDYMVYSENSKLVSLEKEASFRIEKEEDMPVLDGAEACYPLYAAFAKAVYKDIDSIEKQWLKEADDQRFNGKIVCFSNSISGFTRLARDGSDPVKYGNGVDMFFGARPSESQEWFAKESGVEIDITPIGREAFIFFVEADNPIDNLTTEQFKAIYHGDIKNWSEVGGNDQKIKAFQRPKSSGSQTMMEYFMGDVSLKEPETYEVINAMDGIVKRVAQYTDEKGAMGYSFRYFVEELNQEKNVKILSIDGVYPSLESIEDGSYPLVTDVCVMTRKGDINPYIAKMIDFILSEEGQAIVKKTGYAGVDNQPEETVAAIIDLTEENHLSTADALEEFYKDSDYTYYFPSIKSEYIECQFSNGDTMPIKQALDDGKVTVSDLDTYGIFYWKVDKEGKYIKSVDLGKAGGCWRVNTLYSSSNGVSLSEEDSKKISDIIASCKYEIGTEDYANDFVFFREDGSGIYYHSDSGIFNDKENNRSYRISEEQKEWIAELLCNFLVLER